MVDKSKKRKKGAISEDNISTLLRRYSVNTVLALLQEISQVPGEKINWHQMVKNTATGISGAREYQMLWRHLAYGETLVEQIDHAQNPMDDDSDLEYEPEAFPAVGRDALAEAAACVKVLIGSGCTIDSQPPNSSTIEGPLTINIPSSKALSVPSDSSLLASDMQGINVSIPVSLQKVPSCSGFSGEKKPANEPSGVNLPRKRRRPWSMEEDLKLTAAANKSGEPNWENIAKEDFNNDRKASELSQRWLNRKKKQGNLKVETSSQHPETQLAATHRALSMALNMPMGDNVKAASVGIKSQHQPRKPSGPPDLPLGRGGPPKLQVPTKRPPKNLIPAPDSMVKAAAVAAGARIATSADASSLFEAARSQNVVHITTGGGSMMRSSPNSLTNQLPSNVHFIRNGLVKAPISTYSPAKPSIPQPSEAQQAQGHSVKPAPVQKNADDAAVSKEAVQRVPENQSAGMANQSDEVEKHNKSVDQAKDDQVALPSLEAEDSGKKNTYNECTS